MIRDRENIQAIQYQPKHLWFLMLSYAMVISISNWYDARLVLLFNNAVSPGALSFPLSFLLSDVITEVYGYKNARRAIWAALLFNMLFLIFGQMVIHLPTPSFAIESNAAFDKLLTANFWIICGSFVSYIGAEPLNSYLIAKLKISLNGKYVGIRFISSTIIAAFVDSVIFISIAFHYLSIENIMKMMLSVWLLKSFIEIMGLPLSVRLARWLKDNEKLDIYDYKTNFNPFSIDTGYQVSNNFYKN